MAFIGDIPIFVPFVIFVDSGNLTEALAPQRGELGFGAGAPGRIGREVGRLD